MKFDFSKNIKIGDTIISSSSPTYIIAEAGVNHNGDMTLAKKLVDVAIEANVNAIKFQSFKTENLILDSVTKANYQIGNTRNASESQYEMLKKLEINFEQTLELRNYCELKGITFLSTPFDEESLEDLERLNLPAYKVASTDTTNIQFLEKIASKNKPIILSTGMTLFDEINIVLNRINNSNKELILLQCTSNYPMPLEDANLNVLRSFMNLTNGIVGYSDHSEGIGVSPFAVAAGAKVIEKHFTLDKELEGPDHKASLCPKELKEFVIQIRKVDRMLGDFEKKITKNEIDPRIKLQKNVVAKTYIAKGQLFSDKNLIAKRTGGKGISAIEIESLYNTVARKDYLPNQIIE